MKHSVCTLLMIAAFTANLFFSACEEIPPNVDLESQAITDTTFITTVAEPQAKKVLIEEFSGVRCVNCPEANEVTERILTDKNGRLIALTIHAGPPTLVLPYPESLANYVIDEGTTLATSLEVQGLPTASIDRVQFSGRNSITLVNSATWEARIDEQLAVTTPVNINLTKNYEEESRLLQAFVELAYTAAVSEDHFISLALSESHIIDAQLKPDESGVGKVTLDYEHNHLLRDMLTPVTGVAVDAEKVAGRVVIKGFEIVLPDNWVAENCHLIAFVHENGAVKRVIQAEEIGVVE